MSKPDPRHAFTPRHAAKALDLLVDALKKRAGIVVLSGEPGVGKTTTLRKFMLLQREAGHAIFMPDQPALSMDSLLEAVCEDGGITATGSDRLAHLYALRDHVEARLKSGDVCAIVADNGAGAPDAMLRDLGLLADLERNSARPVQIVLSGTSRLIDRLNTPEFNSIRKEIGAVIKLEPFERDETGAYLQHCLAVAGYRGPSLFSFSAIERIHSKTRGVPRAINQVAVAALAALKSSGGKLSPEAIDDAVAHALALPAVEQPVVRAPVMAPPPIPVVQSLPIAAPPLSEIVVTQPSGGLMSQPQTMTVRMMLDKLDREFSTAEATAKPVPDATVPDQDVAAPPPAAPRAEIDKVIADAAGSITSTPPAAPFEIATPEIPAAIVAPAPAAAVQADKSAPSAAELVATALAQVDAEEAPAAPAHSAVAPSPAPAQFRPAPAEPTQAEARPHNSVRQRLMARLTGR